MSNIKLSELKRAVIKEELVALVQSHTKSTGKKIKSLGNFQHAIVLNQMIYWTERMKDTDKFILEEKARYKNEGKEYTGELQQGWIYKKAEELIEETMMGVSIPTMRSILNDLKIMGYLDVRNNPDFKWDKVLQYRVNLIKIVYDLDKLGYHLEGYKYDISEFKNFKFEEKNKNNSNLKNLTSYEKNLTSYEKNLTAIPETTTEITSKITKSSSSTKKIETLNNFYEEAFNKKITNHMKNKINDYIEKTNIDFIIEVLKYCIDHDAKTPSYFFKTLDNLISKNIVTVKDLELSITKHNNSIETKKKSKKVKKSVEDKNKLKFANFTERNYDYDSLEKHLLGWDNEDIES